MIPKLKADKAIRRIKSKICPFCNQKELYAYAPSAARNWWIVGCQSVVCDSSWRIEKDRIEQVEQMIKNAHKLRLSKKPSSPPSYIWVYTVNDKGQVTHERSFPLSCKREANNRVMELIGRGVSAFSSETFIKDAYA